MMKRKMYLAAALIGMGGAAWSGCSDDEKIVEVEKIVIEQDLSKMSDVAREGIKGNPKMITEYFSDGIKEEGKEVKPGAWTEQTVIIYNEAGYMTKIEDYTSFYTNADVASDDPAWITLKDLKFQLTNTVTYSRDANNKCSGIQEESKELRTYLIDSDDEKAMIYDYLLTDQPFEFGYELGLGGTFKSIEVRAVSVRKIVTTIAGDKATSITQSQEVGSSDWVDEKKEILDLDEAGYPNENSKEVFDPITKASAFQTTPSMKYVEIKDEKGNWIIRYTLGEERQYIKRDIVYY